MEECVQDHSQVWALQPPVPSVSKGSTDIPGPEGGTLASPSPGPSPVGLSWDGGKATEEEELKT